MITLNDLKEASQSKLVFLGGTCADSTWRNEIIDKLKIDYFNPIVDDWNEEAQKKELEMREKADYCLYYITPRMQGVYSIAEVVDDSNKRPNKTVFCFVKEDGENKFDEQQIKSLNAVGELVKRNGGFWAKTKDECVKYLNGEMKNDN